MGKKHKGGGMSAPRKFGKKLMSGLRVAVAILGFGGPSIQGVVENIGSPKDIPAGVVYRNTGYNLNTGAFDQEQAKRTALGFLATGIVVTVLSWAGRRI